MNVLRSGARDFDATLVLQRRPFDGTQLARVLWRFPLMTLKVVAAIHWEALRLWLKGARLIPRLRAADAKEANTSLAAGKSRAYIS